jgi:hypothetical protein
LLTRIKTVAAEEPLEENPIMTAKEARSQMEMGQILVLV